LGQAGELQKSPAPFAFESEPDQEQVRDQGGPDFNELGILGSAVKGLDFQVLSIINRPMSVLQCAISPITPLNV